MCIIKKMTRDFLNISTCSPEHQIRFAVNRRRILEASTGVSLFSIAKLYEKEVKESQENIDKLMNALNGLPIGDEKFMNEISFKYRDFSATRIAYNLINILITDRVSSLGGSIPDNIKKCRTEGMAEILRNLKELSIVDEKDFLKEIDVIEIKED